VISATHIVSVADNIETMKVIVLAQTFTFAE
jgi:hypothetical protein